MVRAHTAPRGSEIKIDGVTKRFRDASRAAVDDIHLTISAGRFVVLLGPSGCGKTTLLKTINRLVEPTSGQIAIDGVPIDSVPAPALRRRIGYVIQQVGLFPHMRISENIAVVPGLLKWPKERIDSRVDELLDLVGLPPDQFRRRYPAQLSGGEQQRVGLARALAAEPGILLMDEPFGALDAITRTRLQGELKILHQRLCPTMVFVTHDIEEAVRLADEIVVMRDGRILQAGTPLEIVLRPADDFVRQLVGADDVLRRLRLVSVGAIARRGAVVGPEIAATANAQEALALLVESGAPILTVVDDRQEPIGVVDLSAVHAVSVAEQIPSRLGSR
jgi:osmoprotectant transport system ATP-binding protein